MAEENLSTLGGGSVAGVNQFGTDDQKRAMFGNRAHVSLLMEREVWSMHALVFDEFGEADVLQYRELPDPVLMPGHLLVDVKVSGLNFADIYRRRGTYRGLGEPPYINGYEGAGIVRAVGDGVTDFRVGDRVGFVDVARANVTMLNVSQSRAIALPDSVSFEDAASILLQGLTAQYLCEDSAPVSKGQWVVVHSAAGGVGRHLVRFCRSKGARVIAMASSRAKRQVATDLGADLTLGYDEDWPMAVCALTKGGADIVFNSVGSTLAKSIRATRNKGRIVTFGMSDANPEPVDPLVLMGTSKSLVGGDLWDYLDTETERCSRSQRLFQALADGILQIPPIEVFLLSDGAAAHRRLENRAFSGKIILRS